MKLLIKLKQNQKFGKNEKEKVQDFANETCLRKLKTITKRDDS